MHTPDLLQKIATFFLPGIDIWYLIKLLIIWKSRIFQTSVGGNLLKWATIVIFILCEPMWENTEGFWCRKKTATYLYIHLHIYVHCTVTLVQIWCRLTMQECNSIWWQCILINHHVPLIEINKQLDGVGPVDNRPSTE